MITNISPNYLGYKVDGLKESIKDAPKAALEIGAFAAATGSAVHFAKTTTSPLDKNIIRLFNSIKTRLPGGVKESFTDFNGYIKKGANSIISNKPVQTAINKFNDIVKPDKVAQAKNAIASGADKVGLFAKKLFGKLPEGIKNVGSKVAATVKKHPVAFSLLAAALVLIKSVERASKREGKLQQKHGIGAL